MRNSALQISAAVLSAAVLTVLALTAAGCSGSPPPSQGLWSVYDQGLAGAKYIDLTHTLEPTSPVWRGFGPAAFGPAVNPENGAP